MMRILKICAFFAAWVALWEYGSRSEWWPQLLMPAPSEVGKFLLSKMGDGELLVACGFTIRRLLVGFSIGLGFGIPLGMLTARFRFLNDTVGQVALGLQTLPSVCWVPLSLMWFKQTETAMIFIVVMGTLWAVLLATDHGIRQIPPIYRRAAATMGSSGFHLLRHVFLPASLPHIVSGTKQGWAFAWRSLMAAEIFVVIPSTLSLGHLLHMGREMLAMEQVAAVMLVILLIGLLADKVLFTPWERFLRNRWGLST